MLQHSHHALVSTKALMRFLQTSNNLQCANQLQIGTLGSSILQDQQIWLHLLPEVVFRRVLLQSCFSLALLGCFSPIFLFVLLTPEACSSQQPVPLTSLFVSAVAACFSQHQLQQQQQQPPATYPHVPDPAP
ncbi:UNVERIFIED_CONTAM: hypothetical protein FKN15_038252 [Acipenser sinensis]